MENLIDTYKTLINVRLPATYTFPVRYNHCFGRIILDWLFQDCWYHHLHRNKTAFSQLNEHQLQSAISRMNLWMKDQQVLINDHLASLNYRNKSRSV